MNSFSCRWYAPSNIALVKYWGKLDGQIPCNPSLSLTLKKSLTAIDFQCHKKEKGDGPLLNFTFDDQKNTKFEKKILKFLEKFVQARPEIQDYCFTIKTRNTFPHSAGIASSASSMAALALALTSLEYTLKGIPLKSEQFYKDASNLARGASGSACRSVYPKACLWGELEDVEQSSHLFATPITLHPTFSHLRDLILIVDSKEKAVSSSQGHELMVGHPYKKVRFERAVKHAKRMTKALRLGDWEELAEITEAEALDLHALMMTSTPSYTLLRPATLALIESLKEFRLKTKVKVCFTLDAGPNLHVLYPPESDEEVLKWLHEKARPFLEDGRFILDELGDGPRDEC